MEVFTRYTLPYVWNGSEWVRTNPPWEKKKNLSHSYSKIHLPVVYQQPISLKIGDI